MQEGQRQEAREGKEGEKRILFKVGVVGDFGAGKTAFLFRFVQNRFHPSLRPCGGIDFHVKEVQRKGSTVKLILWDTASQEAFNSIGKSFYRGIDGFLVFFDVANHESFLHLDHWLNEIRQHATTADPAIIVVATKSDLNRDKVPPCAIMQLQEKTGLDVVFTSSKSAINVDSTFETLIDMMIERQRLKDSNHSESLVDLSVSSLSLPPSSTPFSITSVSNCLC